jgi:hypothetical protein
MDSTPILESQANTQDVLDFLNAKLKQSPRYSNKNGAGFDMSACTILN